MDVGQGDGAAAQRGRQFYMVLQDIQDSPFRAVGLLSQETDAISKLQKKENASTTTNIQGRESAMMSVYADEPDRRPDLLRHIIQPKQTSINGVALEDRFVLEWAVIPRTLMWPWLLAKQWALNKLQLMAVLLPMTKNIRRREVPLER